MKKYICQLRDGLMLVQEDNVILREYTGYPYPETELSNIKMFQKLIYDETGILKPDEFFYNYVDLINIYFQLFPNTATVSSFTTFFVKDDFLNLSELQIYVYQEIVRTDSLIALLNTKSDGVLIVGYEIADKLKVSNHMLLPDSFVDAVTMYLYNNCNYDGDMDLDITELHIKLLTKLYLGNNNSKYVRNIELNLENFLYLLYNYICEVKLSDFYTSNYLRQIMNFARNNYGLSLDKNRVFEIYKAFEEEDVIYECDFTEKLLVLLCHINKEIGNNINDTVIVESCYLFIHSFLSSLAFAISNMINMKGNTRNFRKICEVSYKEGVLKVRVKGIDFIQLEAKADHFSLFWTQIRSAVTIRCSSASIKYNIDYEFDNVGANYNIESSDTLVWNLSTYIAKDSLDLIPMLFEAHSHPYYSGVQKLYKNNRQEEILSGMYRNLYDTRYIIFKNRKSVKQLLEELYNCFIYYNRFLSNSSTFDSDNKEVDNITDKYFRIISKSIINLVGDFSLFARIFCYMPEAFKLDAEITYFEGGISYKYIMSMCHLKESNIDNLDISEEMFEDGLRGACIVDFMAILLLNAVTAGDVTAIPISINNISVSFDENTQQVELLYRVKGN